MTNRPAPPPAGAGRACSSFVVRKLSGPGRSRILCRMGRVVVVALIAGVVLGLLGSGAGIAFFEATGQGRLTGRGGTATAIPERFPTVSGVGGSNRTPIAGATPGGPFTVDWQ